MTKLLGSEWSIDKIYEADAQCAKLADKYGLDTYPNQYEIVSFEQMIDRCCNIGMPIGYNHWSFGKQIVEMERRYKEGKAGLAYEMVINSNPCINYLMDSNSMAMQTLVIAHAGYGHNSFFKNNYLFKEWTNADAVLDYIYFAKSYIKDCEDKYGVESVESILDACHSLMSYGVDQYKKPQKLNAEKEKQRQKEREQYYQSRVHHIWDTIIEPSDKPDAVDGELEEVEENILYFIEKNSIVLKPWQREIIRIVRKMSQYFYPQRQTKVSNEGWATFWHHLMLNELYDDGIIPAEYVLECLGSHAGVVFQLPYDHQYYSGINPYTLGYSMYTDIRRICEQPDTEDIRWFPQIAGSNWLETLHYIMNNFKDESFIAQFLSPKVMRDLRLFSFINDEEKSYLEISGDTSDEGYKIVRNALSNEYNLNFYQPSIAVQKADMKGDRVLHLRYNCYNDRRLTHSYHKVKDYIEILWGFPVNIRRVDF